MKIPVTWLLNQALGASALRQRVIANNVANANTPGFKRSEVTFEEHMNTVSRLKLPLAGAHQAHLPVGEAGTAGPRIKADTSTSMRADGNNVDIDLEMVLMSANAIKYQALSQQLGDHFGMLRYVINEGRR